MTLVIRIVFFCLIFFSSISIALSEINLKIIMKINNEIITSYDIEKERDYLLALNPNLKEIENDQLIMIAKKSLTKEIIRKIEILKYVELKQENSQIDNVLNNLIKNLNFANKTELQNYLQNFGISIYDLKKKLKLKMNGKI